MVDLDQEETLPPTTANMYAKKKDILSSAMKRTSEWISSQEIPSDVTVHAGETFFSLHKFPLVARCGYIRKLVSQSSDADLSTVELPDIPGGAEAFELAAKFCYGINFEISTENIAMLRCVAEYLEMTEDYSGGNLVARTESYLNEVALKSLSGAISILQKSESLLPMAETVKLVSRCIDLIAYMACKDTQFSMSRSDSGIEGLNSSSSGTQLKPPIVDWWVEDLTVLRIDIFQRVLIAMMARGFKNFALGPILMLYAQQSLRGLEIFVKGRKKIEPRQEHEKRVVLETIVSLLPREKNAMSVSFLSMLLRAAIYLETTVACRLDLEKRMGLQLGQAVLDDLLIPSFSFTGDAVFDVDAVQRIVMNYLECEMDSSRLGYVGEDGFFSPPPSDTERVGRLMESYLAEIASDRNLSVSKFISLGELVPEQSRVTEDGMYRAIDIFLKEKSCIDTTFLGIDTEILRRRLGRAWPPKLYLEAHPDLSDLERKKVCSVMDCQKLSREACAHAAQNDRLPVQTVVQVLYYEQQRLREAVNGSESPAPPHTVNLYTTTTTDRHPVPDELSTLRRENQDLKFELLKMKMKFKEIEKPAADKSGIGSPSRSSLPSSDKPPLPRKSIISSVSKKLGRLYPFVRDGATAAKGRTKPPKDRRHSIS